MKDLDQTLRFIFDESDIRGEITHLTRSFQEAYEHQSFPDELQPLFGQFLAGASLLSEVLKFEGILTLQAKGTGDVALVMAETDHQGNLRGIIRMNETQSGHAYPQLIHELIPNGTLVITIDPTRGERYQGIVALDKPTLAECLSQYFEQSEQLPTHISLFATTDQAAGLFLQCLPAQEVKDQELREDQWETAIKLAETCQAQELFELEQETLLYRLFNELKCRVFTPKHLRFHCSCSWERSANALISIGKEEAESLLQERDIINIDCQFCGQGYSFSHQDLSKLFDTDTPLH